MTPCFVRAGNANELAVAGPAASNFSHNFFGFHPVFNPDKEIPVRSMNHIPLKIAEIMKTLIRYFQKCIKYFPSSSKHFLLTSKNRGVFFCKRQTFADAIKFFVLLLGEEMVY